MTLAVKKDINTNQPTDRRRVWDAFMPTVSACKYGICHFSLHSKSINYTTSHHSSGQKGFMCVRNNPLLSEEDLVQLRSVTFLDTDVIPNIRLKALKGTLTTES